MSQIFEEYEDDGIDYQEDKYLIFCLEDREYALAIKEIIEIIENQEARPVPEYPPYVKGIINTKRRIIPVIDLRMRLGMQEAVGLQKNCILVTCILGLDIGFVVDSVNSVLDIDPSLISKAPDITINSSDTYLRGVANLDDRLIMMLDLNKIVSENEVKKMEYSTEN